MPPYLTETKHHTRANKFQGKTYQANSPATRNTALSSKIQAAQNHIKTMTKSSSRPTQPLLQSVFRMVSVGVVDEPINQFYDIISTGALILNLLATSVTFLLFSV